MHPDRLQLSLAHKICLQKNKTDKQGILVKNICTDILFYSKLCRMTLSQTWHRSAKQQCPGFHPREEGLCPALKSALLQQSSTSPWEATVSFLTARTINSNSGHATERHKWWDPSHLTLATVLVSARTGLFFTVTRKGVWPGPNVIQYHLTSISRDWIPIRRRNCGRQSTLVLLYFLSVMGRYTFH